MLCKKIKKSIVLTVSSILMITLLVNLAFAADVAYIYKKEKTIDQNVLDVFEEMGLSVAMIKDKNMPSSFSGYKFVFLGDERVSNSKKIPVGQVSSVIMNKNYGSLFGLTDRNGISRFISSTTLTVITGGKDVQVYESAFKRARVSIPSYYLQNEHRADSLQTVAAVEKRSGNHAGDIISYASPGDKLENGKTIQKEICFFGIVETDYWTEEARKMFKDCVQFVLSGSPNACETNADCGTDGFVGENFCSGGDVVRKFKKFVCNDSCSSTEENRVVQTCVGGCSAGSCSQSSGEIHNLALVNVTNAVGSIRIETISGEDILPGESLQCNEKYKVAVKAKNLGNYTENATFEGSVGSLDIAHSDIIELEPGKTSDRSKTINFSLAEGNYDITIELGIDGFADSNPLDNLAKRNVHISCGATSGCSQNSDCGMDGFVGNTFCMNNDVGKKYKIFSCGSGSCSSTEEDRVFQTCSNGCSNGACVSSSGLIHDVALVNVTNAVGLIRLQTSSGTDIPAGTSLQCNQKYKIIIKPKNFGNYTENITFGGSVGSLAVDYSPVVLDAGETGSTKTKTLNFTLAAGTYNLNVEAILNGFADSNPSNNVASKQITVSC